jgi:membrane-associated phospholipid phosphatase
VAFSVLMGLSRAYLGAHWLSDATAGILLGTSCALLAALLAGLLQQQQHRRRLPAGTQQAAAVLPPERAGRGRRPA